MTTATIPQASGLFNASPRPAVERLARIEGQSNFLSLLAGVEAGADTTEDMGALSFARRRGCVPEVLEAWVAQSGLFRLPLMSIVYRAVLSEFKPDDKDLPWIQGAIADAFLLMRYGECKPLSVRAKRFKTDISAYSAMRKVAHSVFLEMCDRAEREWHRARKSESPEKGHTVGVEGNNSRGMSPGCFFATPLGTAEDGDEAAFDTRGLGILDLLGWDERNGIKPGPVLELHGEDAELHCKAHPSQTSKTL